MILEIDEVALDKVLWSRAVAGDERIKEELRRQINKLESSMRLVGLKPTEQRVSLKDLEKHGIITHIRLFAAYEKERS